MTVNEAVEAIATTLRAPEGLVQSMRNLGIESNPIVLDAISTQVLTMQPTVDILEKCRGFRGPAYLVYCRKATTRGKERMVPPQTEFEVEVEVLVTSDSLEGLTDQAAQYASAVSDSLRRSAGCIGGRMLLSEKQTLLFDPIKKGGLYLYQSATVQCNVIAFIS